MSEKEYTRLEAWLLATRPKTLPAALGPVLVGTAAAWHDNTFVLLPALAAFIGALLLQVAVNLANDYFDAKNSIDSEERLGPLRVTQAGLIPPGQVKAAMIICLLLAALVFLYLTVVAGPILLVVGVISVLAALAYSGGPYPIASHGLGELFVFIFFGPVAVCCTYFVQAGRFSLSSLAASIPPGLLITAIMIINNLRDIPTDEKAGKRTLAVRLGREKTMALYQAMLVGAYIVPLIFILFGYADFVMLAVALSLPMMGSLLKEVREKTGALLNETLARTAQFSLLFSLLFSLGLLL